MGAEVKNQGSHNKNDKLPYTACKLLIELRWIKFKWIALCICLVVLAEVYSMCACNMFHYLT